MKKQKKCIIHLNRLLILNCQNEKLFLQVLDEVHDKILKNFFSVAAYERRRFIKDLDSKIRKKGGIPTYLDESMYSDNLTTLNIKNLISTTKESSSLFTEIGRIQLQDIEKYDKTLHSFLFPKSIEKLLSSQRDTIVKSLYSIKVHEDFFAKKTVAF